MFVGGQCTDPASCTSLCVCVDVMIMVPLETRGKRLCQTGASVFGSSTWSCCPRTETERCNCRVETVTLISSHSRIVNPASCNLEALLL